MEYIWKYIKNKTVMVNIILITIIFILLELTSNKFFLNGDNKVQFFPVIKYASECILNGSVPQIDFSQYLGLPILERSYYGLKYIPVYISYIISKYVILDEFWTIDLFVYFHLVAAGVAISLLLRTLNIKSYLNIIGVLSYIFTSAILFMSEWYYIFPTLLYFPLVVLLLLNLANGKHNILYYVGLLTILVVYFYVGNIQLYFYSIFYLFPLVFLVFIKNFRSKKFILTALITTLVYIISIFPGIYNDLQIGSTARPEKVTFSEYNGVNSDRPLKHIVHMILPNVITNNMQNLMYRFENRYIMAYAGLVPILGLILGCIFFTLKRRFNIGGWVLKYFMIMGILSLIFVFGDKTLIYTIMYKIPIWNQFRSSSKHIFFTNFFLITSGMIFIKHMFEYYKISIETNILKYLLLITSLFIIINNYSMSNAIINGIHDPNKINSSNFSIYSDKKITKGRIALMAGGLLNIHDKGTSYSKFLAFNYASLCKNVMTIGGYDVLLDKKIFQEIFKGNWYSGFFEPSDISFFSKYSLRYILFPGIFEKNEIDSLTGLIYNKDYKIIYGDNDIKIIQLKNFEHLAKFEEDGLEIPDENINIDFKGNRININLENLKFTARSTIIANFLYYKDYKAKDNNNNSLVLLEDPMHRIKIQGITKTVKSITLYYENILSIVSLIISTFYFILFLALTMLFILRYTKGFNSFSLKL